MTLLFNIKNMNILLNWFPPAFNKIPSPAMSILKGYLNQYGYETDVCYWNLIFRDIIASAVEVNKEKEANEFEALWPFLAVLLNNSTNKDRYERLCVYYQTKYPQYINISNDNYYSESLLEYSKDIVVRFENIIDLMFSKKKYNLIGVSTKLLQLIPANIFADISKSINPHVPIVAGGMSNKNEAIAALEDFEVYDFTIWGEGENSLHQLCRYLENEIPIEEVPNLVYRIGDEVRFTKGNRSFSDLSLIKPDYSDYFDFLKTNEIHDMNILLPIESSRGCHWNKCKFCFLTEGYRNRSKNNNSIIDEILFAINNYDQYEFVFLDNDIIFNNFDKFDDLLDKLSKIKDKYEKFGIWNGEVITKNLNSTIVKKMTFAGFKSIQIGYEAISDSLLSKINKKNTFSSNLMFVKWATLYNLDLQGLNIITGLLEENDADILSSIKNLHFLRFFLERNVTKHDVVPLQIMKSSRYYNYIKENNDLDVWSDNLLYELFPKSYISHRHKFDLMFFSSTKRNNLWVDFEKIDSYYSTTNYSYKLYRNSNNIVQYIERINEEIILKLEFDVINSFHWRILECCNNEVCSLDDIINHLELENNNISQEYVKNTLMELNSEYIMYSNLEYSENISIINTDFIY